MNFNFLSKDIGGIFSKVLFFILSALFFGVEALYTSIYWHGGSGGVFWGGIYLLLGLLFAFRVLEINRLIKWSLYVGVIFAVSSFLILLLGIGGLLFFPVVLVTQPLMIIFLIIGIVIAVKEKFTRKNDLNFSPVMPVGQSQGETAAVVNNVAARPKRTKLRLVLFVTVGLLLIAGAYFLSFGSPIPLPKTSIVPTRAVVVKAKEGAEAPFSLSTHVIPIPENFTQLSENRGHFYLEADSLTFSPDGTRAAYFEHFGNTGYVIVDNKAFEIPKDFYSGQVGLVFSKDSNNLFFILYKNIFGGQLDKNQSVLVTKNRNSSSIVFSGPPQENGTVYVVGSERFSVGDVVYNPPASVQSSDDKKTASIEVNGGCGELETNQVHVFVKQGSNVVFESKDYSCGHISDPVFAPNNKDVAYKVSPANQVSITDGYGNFVAINDKPGQTFGAFADGSIRFSPDGKYIAYGAAREDKLWWIVEEVVPDAGNQTVKYLKDIKVDAAKDNNSWRILSWDYDYSIFAIPYPSTWNVKSVIDKNDFNTDLFIFPGETMEGKDFIHVTGVSNNCAASQGHVKCEKMFDNKIAFFTDSNNQEVLQKFDELIKKITPSQVPTNATVVSPNSLTASSKTYTNNTYNFTFSYPKDSVTVTNSGSSKIIIDYIQNDANFHNQKGQWTIQVYSNPTKASLQSWLTKLFNDSNDNHCDIMSSSDLQANLGKFQYDSISSVQTMQTSGPVCKNEGFYAISPDKSIVIKFGQLAWGQGFISNIISSFNFTK